MTALTPRSRYLLIVALALTSGAVMATAGYVLRTDGWTVASLVTVPGGLLIAFALALMPRSTRRQAAAPSQAPAERRRSASPIAALIVGQLTASGGLPVRYGIAVSLLALLSGGAMVGAGYEAAGSAWLPAAVLVMLGGVVITAALTLAIIGHRQARARS